MYKLHAQLDHDTFKLGQSALCDVLLMNDANYPWIILVPRRVNVREIYDLQADDLEILQSESTTISKALMGHFSGEKFNFAALGNMVPQLHLHHVVRFSTDAAWPKPIWGVVPATAYSTEQSETLIAELQLLFKDQLDSFQPC